MPELRAGRIVIKRNAIAECLSITGEIVIVEDVERFGAKFQVHALFDDELLRDRDIDVAVWRSADIADARTGAEVSAAEKSRSARKRRRCKLAGLRSIRPTIESARCPG